MQITSAKQGSRCLATEGYSAMETVVLVHGLWVPSVIMHWLTRRIGRCGFEVKVYFCPSVRLSRDVAQQCCAFLRTGRFEDVAA